MPGSSAGMKASGRPGGGRSYSCSSGCRGWWRSPCRPAAGPGGGMCCIASGWGPTGSNRVIRGGNWNNWNNNARNCRSANRNNNNPDNRNNELVRCFRWIWAWGKLRLERQGYRRRAPARHPSSVTSGMFRVKCMATTVFVGFISMPFLTELVSSEDGFCYRHGAPNGAVPPSQHSIRPKTAKNPLSGLRRRFFDFKLRRS